MIRVLCVIGSAFDESITATAVHYTARYLADFEADVTVIDLRKTSLPLFNPSTKHKAKHYEYLRALVHDADVFLLATPDYHGSMSGTLKNFLDYFWTEFAGKVFGYVCSSFEKGLTAMDHVRTCIRQCYGWSLPYGVSLTENDIKNNEVINDRVQERLQMLARDLVVYGDIITRQRNDDLLGTDTRTFMARYRTQG